jgi:hypothetical protein
MKLRKFLKYFFSLSIIIFTVFSSDCKILQKVRKDDLASKALIDVVQEIFISRGISFEIVIFGEVSLRVGDTIDNLVTNVQESQSIKITRHEVLTEIANTALVFVSPKLIKGINKIGLRKWFPTTNKILFFLDHENMIDLNLLKEDLTHNSRGINQYAYYFVDYDTKVELKTFEWWTEAACNQPQLITLNTFHKQISKWEQNQKIQDKFMNFHGCTLKSQSMNIRTAFFHIANNNGLKDNNSLHQNYYTKKEKTEEKIAKLFAEQGNFSINRSEYNAYNDDRELYVFFQAAQAYQSDITHLEAGCSLPYYDGKMYLIYSPPDPYTTYEKMTLPFDADTWMYLFITYGVFFASILIIKILPRRIQNVVFGLNVKSPIFNVIRGIFGAPQTLLPRNSFARFILINFVIFCFIFRTAYQGEHFIT